MLYRRNWNPERAGPTVDVPGGDSCQSDQSCGFRGKGYFLLESKLLYAVIHSVSHNVVLILLYFV